MCLAACTGRAHVTPCRSSKVFRDQTLTTASGAIAVAEEVLLSPGFVAPHFILLLFLRLLGPSMGSVHGPDPK